MFMHQFTDPNGQIIFYDFDNGQTIDVFSMNNPGTVHESPTNEVIVTADRFVADLYD